MTIQNLDNCQNLETRLKELNQYKIDLSLDRLKTVINRLKPNSNQQIITVGGTNGKGSTVSALTALLGTQNKSYGAFTSPHIFKFNERININGQVANDQEILDAFDAIDDARGEVHLSYFEFNFLAAWLIFINHEVDVMLLEVGLGGRLDAVNSIDADCVIITTVDLDHTDKLGDDIESIAYEKAGIMRSQKPAIYGDVDMPNAIKDHAKETNAQLLQYGLDYQAKYEDDKTFSYKFGQHQYMGLSKPKMNGDWQLKNFSAALTALNTLGYSLEKDAIEKSLSQWQLAGRLQTIQTDPTVLVDVAHNKQAATQLSSWLKANPVKGSTSAVFSVLADKNVESWLDSLDEVIDHWFIFQLGSERALDLYALKLIMADQVTLISQFDSGKQAYNAALSSSSSDDRIIVFGSFHVLEEVFK